MKRDPMANKPGICFVSMEVYPNLCPGVAEEAGGAGFQIVQLARGLRDRGYQVSFVVGDYGQAFREEIEGFTVLRANRVAYDRSLVRGLKNIWRLFLAMRAANARHYVLRSTRFLSFFVMFYTRLLGAKYTFMVANLPHCLRNELESLPRVFRILYEISISRADRVTVQSVEQRELLLANFGITAPVVPNGIEVPEFEGARLSAPYDFVWVASFKVQKRADYLVDIAKLLPERRFLVVGGPGPDKPYSANLVAQLKQLANVEFRGFVTPDKVGDVYREARIFLNTSDWEGFPNGFLYAWTRGMPACSLCIDPDGIVAGGNLGLVIEDPVELARELSFLLDNDRRYAAMAKRCHDHVLRHHSRKHSVDTFLAALP